MAWDKRYIHVHQNYIKRYIERHDLKTVSMISKVCPDVKK